MSEVETLLPGHICLLIRSEYEYESRYEDIRLIHPLLLPSLPLNYMVYLRLETIRCFTFPQQTTITVRHFQALKQGPTRQSVFRVCYE